MHEPAPHPESCKEVGASFHLFPSRYCTVSSTFSTMICTSDAFSILSDPATTICCPNRLASLASFQTSALGRPGGGDPTHPSLSLTVAIWGLTQAVVASPTDTPAAARAPSPMARRRLMARSLVTGSFGIPSDIGILQLTFPLRIVADAVRPSIRVPS